MAGSCRGLLYAWRQRYFFSVYALEGHRLQLPNHLNLRFEAHEHHLHENVKSHVQSARLFVFPLTTKVRLGAPTVLTSSKWSQRHRPVIRGGHEAEVQPTPPSGKEN